MSEDQTASSFPQSAEARELLREHALAELGRAALRWALWCTLHAFTRVVIASHNHLVRYGVVAPTTLIRSGRLREFVVRTFPGYFLVSIPQSKHVCMNYLSYV